MPHNHAHQSEEAVALAEKAALKEEARRKLVARVRALHKDGLSNTVIAGRLEIGVSTVRVYLKEATGSGASADTRYSRPHQPRSESGAYRPLPQRASPKRARRPSHVALLRDTTRPAFTEVGLDLREYRQLGRSRHRGE